MAVVLRSLAEPPLHDRLAHMPNSAKRRVTPVQRRRYDRGETLCYTNADLSHCPVGRCAQPVPSPTGSFMLRRFFRSELAAAVVLLVAAVLAMVAANSLSVLPTMT